MTNHHQTGLMVSSLFLLMAHSPLRANDMADAYPFGNAFQEHVQVTATRTKERDIDIAAAVTAIDEETIREQSPDVIAEMLRAEPGTFFQQTTPGQGIPIIRGLKGSQVLHMVDGIRLNNALFRNAPNQYLGLVDSFAAQRMEIVRGSQGSLYGADAMGGVLNILTWEPDRYENHRKNEEGQPGYPQESSLYGSYDSVDNGWVLSARTRFTDERWAFTGGASYQDHSSRKAGNGRKLTPSAYQSRAADLKFVTDSGEHSSLMISTQIMEQPSTPRYDELVPGYGQDEPSSEQFLFEPNRRSFFHARFRLEGQSAWFDQFEAHVARQVVTDDRLTQEYGSPEIVTEHNSSVLDGISLQFNSRLASGRQLVWGAEYYMDDVDSKRFTHSENSGMKNTTRSRFPDDSAMDSAAVYLSGKWFNSNSFNLDAGLRYSWFNINLPSNETHEALVLTPADLTGDLHAVFQLNPGLKLVANLGRGFRPPNIFDLATLGPRPGNRFNIANTGLDPESVWSYDLGIKVETGGLELEIFAFYLDYSDKITTVFIGGTTEDGRDIVRSENRNNVKIHGVEAGMYHQVSDDLRIFSVINYTRGEEHGDLGPGFPADRIPPINGRLGLEYRVREKWHIKPFLLFASQQDRLSPRDTQDPRIKPGGTPGWGTLNLLLDWQMTPLLQLGLRLENLGNKAYREHASGIDAAGRNIGLWLNHTFW